MTRRTPLIRAFVYLGLLLVSAPGGGGAATLEGRIIHPARPTAAAGLTVTLTGLGVQGEPFETRTTTDESGRFSFPELPARGAYILGTTYEGIRFPGGSVVFGEGKPETQSSVFHIYDRTSDPVGARIESMRFVVTREGGTYRVEQRALIQNPTLEVVVVGEESPPLLRIALAPGHGEIQAPFGRLPEGTQVRNGIAEIRGPLFPGEQSYALAYDLPGSGETLQTEFRVVEALSELQLLVRDFGVEVDAGALYPGRPAKEGDSIYLRYVGFDLAPDTLIPFRVVPLAPPTSLARWLQGLLVLALGGGLLLMVMRPIESGAPARATPEKSGPEPEREAIMAALQDLEFDYETGKLSDEDHDRLRAELREEAVRTLARARKREQPPSPRTCRCGRIAQAGDRFCAACGEAL